VSTGFLAILVFTTWFTTLSGSAGLYPCMILACVAAVVLAYRSEEFRSSPVGKIRIGRVPLIVPAGILGICFLTGVFIAYLMDSAYGVNSTTSLALIGCSLGAGLIIFIVSYFIRRSRGVNLSQIYRQIPPM